MRKSNSTQLDIQKILQILPHRYPFVLVDKVLEQTHFEDGPRVGQKVSAIKCVSIGEPFFTGHFPHRPVMPGVLIVEALAQAAALACWRPKDPKNDLAIARISEVRVRRPVVPGDVLQLQCEVLKDRGDMILAQCKACVDDQLVTETEILATVITINKKSAQ